jgi:iron(III) transport system permease protein
MSPTLARTILAVTTAFFAVFFFWPIAQILRGGFVNADGAFTLAYLIAVLADPLYLGALANSLAVAAATTLLAMAIALPLAWLSDRYVFPGKGWLNVLVLLPMVLPPFVGAIGIKQVFGQYGAFNALLIAVHLRPAGWTFDWFAASQFWGVVLVQALSLYPILYLNATAALANVDPAMEEAAENLGCTGLRRFRRVTLPLMKPGLFAGGTIIFIWAFTELGTPLVFDYAQVASVQIYYGLREIGGNPLPYVLVTLLLLTSVALYVGGKGVFGRNDASMMAKATAASGPRPLPRARAWLCTMVFAGLVLLAALPHLGVVLAASSREWYASVLPHDYTLQNFRLALGHDLTVGSISNSLKYASVSTVIDVLLGVSIAYVVVRSRVAGRQWLDLMAMLPLAVPGLVLAFGFLAMTQDGRLLAGLNPARDPTFLLIVAYSIRRLPYVVRSAAAGLQQTSPALEEAAQNLGARPLRALRRVALPLISANLIAGALLAFSFAMLEVSDSLVLAQKQAFYPITKAILDLFQLLGDGKFIACALGVWAMVFLALTTAALSNLLGKRLGLLFRI